MGEYLLSGSILCGEDFDVVEGYICIRDGMIAEICEESGAVDALAHGIVLPAFVNAHTHLGDSVLKDPPITDIASLVRPPDGLKHRVLAATSAHDLVRAMRASICDMAATGTCAFADFREGGLSGVRALVHAIDAASTSGCAVDAMIFGRPGGGSGGRGDSDVAACGGGVDAGAGVGGGDGASDGTGWAGAAVDEIDSILELAGGIGISSTNDYARRVATAIAERTRRQRGVFAIHAGELDSTDIVGALELNPDLLIHLTHASCDDLRGVAEKNIPVVVCVRSNLVTRVGIPPVKEMLAAGLLVAAGTDNVMFNSVDLFSEMRFLSSLCQIDEGQVLRICTRAGALALGLNCGIIEHGVDAKVTVLDKDSHNLTGARNILRSVVRRARAGDIIFCSGDVGGRFYAHP